MLKIKIFLNPIEGRQNYLNNLADQGYRLVASGGVIQRFEEDRGHDYHYIVQYIGYMTNQVRIDYCAFLHGLGYKTLYSPLNIGKISFGNLRVRPYNDGKAAFVTNPGMINKEVLIIETIGSQTLPVFSDKSEQELDLKRRLRPAWYLLMVSLFMILMSVLIAVGSSYEGLSWALYTRRLFDTTPWPWLLIGGTLLGYSMWSIMRIKSLIKTLD